MPILRNCAAAAAIALAATAGSANPLACDGIPVTVRAVDAALAARICEAASRALPRLAECGVELSHPQTVEVADSLPQGCRGIYHCGENRIEVLSPEALQRERLEEGPFHPLPTLVYFDSVIAHELAHAAYDAVPCPYDDCLATSEYVAYAMQVRSLPPEHRAAFEAEIEMDVRVRRHDISPITLMLAPGSFAGKVWSHFAQREDGCAYVAQMMAGELYLDVERP